MSLNFRLIHDCRPSIYPLLVFCSYCIFCMLDSIWFCCTNHYFTSIFFHLLKYVSFSCSPRSILFLSSSRWDPVKHPFQTIQYLIPLGHIIRGALYLWYLKLSCQRAVTSCILISIHWHVDNPQDLYNSISLLGVFRGFFDAWGWIKNINWNFFKNFIDLIKKYKIMSFPYIISWFGNTYFPLNWQFFEFSLEERSNACL